MLEQLEAFAKVLRDLLYGLVSPQIPSPYMPTPPAKTALITGFKRQDISYLAELFLEKGCQLLGIKLRASSINTSRVDHHLPGPA